MRSPWVARYRVDAGPPIRVERLDVRLEGEGRQDTAFQAFLQSFPVEPGDTLRHRAYESAKASLARLAAERGYLDAAWDTALVRVDLEAYTSEVVLHFDTGPRFRFGEVAFFQDVVDEEILRPYVEFEVGAPYEGRRLRALGEALNGTTYFSAVEVRPRRDLAGDDRRVPIEVEATARRTQRYEIGVGYSTDTGARIRLTAEFRRLNRPGHFADADVRLAERDRSINARYNIPVGFPYPALWTIGGRYGRTTWTTSETTQGLVGLSFSHLRGPVREVLAVHFQQDDYVVGPDTGVASLTVPTATWTYTVADNQLYAQRGLNLVAQLSGAVQGVGSTAGFAAVKLRAKWIRGLSGRLRTQLRSDLGYIATSQFRELPPSLRFFAGGDQTIRGYPHQSLGATDAAGNVIGGNTLAVGSAELEYRFLEKWGAAVFVDGGNAFDGFRGPVAVGAGVGARWISPVGQVRIDLAWGFERDAYRVHLVIGPDL